MKTLLSLSGIGTTLLFFGNLNLAYAADMPAAAPAFTDPQIAAIVVSANSVDIDAGKLAGSKAHDGEVKKFAKLMVTDHSAVNKSAVALVTKLKVTPEKNPTSDSLDNGGKENLASLKKLKGHDFDKAYVDHEVTYHQQVLDVIDNKLIPSASNAELKALLVKTRPTIAAHLEHAQHLAESMK